MDTNQIKWAHKEYYKNRDTMIMFKVKQKECIFLAISCGHLWSVQEIIQRLSNQPFTVKSIF